MDISPLIEKFRANYKQLERELSDPEVFSDLQNYECLTREHQRLSTLLTNFDQLSLLRTQLADNNSMLDDETDGEFRSVIETDIAELTTSIEALDALVLSLVIPPDEHDSRNTIVEIRPAAGGDEAGLFAGDLFRMYTRFAETRKWRTDILSMTTSEVGGVKEVAFTLEGENVFRAMKLESGVHRVQRVPTTEASGRIHTSTVTVAVLPEAKDIDIKINPEDLRFDVFRSSGPGGQSVNTTDSAVRVTHIPSGMSVASQQEKSQHRNKEIAMRILRSRLLEAKEREEAEKHASQRKTQIGTGDRSERIRTYNFPQNRITDHRYGLSFYSLPDMLNGNIGELIERITAVDNLRRLEEELQST